MFEAIVVDAMRERPLSPSSTFHAARAKVWSQGRPVTRRENRRRLQWVASGHTPPPHAIATRPHSSNPNA